MLCPKDNVVCDTRQLDGVEVDVCPKCQGVWLEQTEVQKLVRYLALPEHTDVDELLEKWENSGCGTTTPGDFWQEAKLICPKEGAQMQKHYFAGTGVGIDQCQVCKGFWLDGGELQAVAKLAAPNPAEEKIGMAMASLAGRTQSDRLSRMRPKQVHGAGNIPPLSLSGVHPAFAILQILGSFFYDWLPSEH